MRKLALFLSLGLLLLAAAPPAWSQATPPSLEYKMIKGFAFEDPLVSMSAVYLQSSQGRPVDIKGTPAEAKGELRYFVGEVGTRQIVVAMDSAAPANLFVGKDGGNDFTDVKPLRRTKASGSNGMDYQYGPALLKASGAADGAAGRVLLASFQSDYVMLYPAGYLAGQIKAGGKTYKIALVDGDFDGQYTCPAEPAGSMRPAGANDVLAIDLDGDGKFVYMANGQLEIRPLTKLARLGDNYYEVKVAADGSNIEVVAAKPKMGTLAIKGADVQLMLLGVAGPEYLMESSKSWQLPEGRYTCQQVKLVATDKKGDKWMLEASGKTGKLRDIEIKAGETFTMTLGAPLTVKADVQQQESGWVFRGKTVAVGFTILGAAGEEYAPGADKNGTRVPAPKISIYNEKDEVLATGDFEYG